MPGIPTPEHHDYATENKPLPGSEARLGSTFGAAWQDFNRRRITPGLTDAQALQVQ
jgi:hypothetical protein